MAKWMAQRSDWGVVFFGYDLFAAFRSDMLAQVADLFCIVLLLSVSPRQHFCRCMCYP